MANAMKIPTDFDLAAEILADWAEYARDVTWIRHQWKALLRNQRGAVSQGVYRLIESTLNPPPLGLSE